MADTEKGRPRNAKGSVMVEFALGFGAVLLILAGVLEFGYTFYLYNTLQSTVRDAARYASLRPYDANSNTAGANWETAVQNMATYGEPNPAGGEAPMVPGMGTSYVTTNTTMDGIVPVTVTVSVAGLTVSTFFREITLNGNPSVTFPYMGRVLAPSGGGGPGGGPGGGAGT